MHRLLEVRSKEGKTMQTLILVVSTLLMTQAAAQAEPRPGSGAAAKPARHTLDTPIHVLMDDPRTLAFLDKHFPGMSDRMSDPEIGAMFAGVSLQGLSIDPDHGRTLTPEVMARLAVALEKAQAEPSPPS